MDLRSRITDMAERVPYEPLDGRIKRILKNVIRKQKIKMIYENNNTKKI